MGSVWDYFICPPHCSESFSSDCCISIAPVNTAISEDEGVIHALYSSYVFLPSTYMFSLNPVIAQELAAETDGGCHTYIQMMKK